MDVYFPPEIILHSARGEIHALEKKLQPGKLGKPDTKDIEEALLVAIRNGHDFCIPSLVVGGARRLDCALYLAIQLERVKAIAILLLSKATITGDCSVIKSLLSEPPDADNAPWYMVDVHNILSQGVIKMSHPIAVSIIEKNYEATKELLLRTDLDMRRKLVDWSKLKLTLLHPSWMYSISPWVVSLKLVNNHLRRLPVELFAATQLRRLDLSQNLLETIQPNIFALPNIEYLCLAHNRIREIPETTVWSQSLLSLDLAENMLTTLPQGIQSSYIEILNLCNNQFTSIPKCLCHITTLTSLDLSSTLITSFPHEMQQLDHLVNLNVSNANISDLPGGGGILRGGIKGIFKAHARSSKTSNYVKLVLICNTERVKGAMLSRLKSHFVNSEPLPEFEQFQWSYRPLFTRKLFGTHKLHFNTWLLGSGYEYHSIYPCFFTPGALYVLVWDITSKAADMREQIKIYMDHLVRYAPTSNVLIISILPEGYESILDTNYEGLAKRLGGFFSKPTYSSLTYHGLMMVVAKQNVKEGQSDIKQQIYDIASAMTVNGQLKIGRQYPETYFHLLPVLEKEQHTFKVREKPGVLEETTVWTMFDKAVSSDVLHRMELPVVVDFLQEAGFLLHYEDPNERLDQYYFTRPIWLYKTLLKVIRHALQNSTHIEVTHHELCSLTNVNWSKDVSSALIRLMVRYAIILPTRNNCYVIACLLPHCVPTSADLFCGNLRRQFAPKSKGMPSDLWMRVICRILTNLPRITDMTRGELGEEGTLAVSKEKQLGSDKETNELAARKLPPLERSASTPDTMNRGKTSLTHGGHSLDTPSPADHVIPLATPTPLEKRPSELTVLQIANRERIEESDDGLTPIEEVKFISRRAHSRVVNMELNAISATDGSPAPPPVELEAIVVPPTPPHKVLSREETLADVQEEGVDNGASLLSSKGQSTPPRDSLENHSTTPQVETSSKGEGGRGNRSTTPQAETSSKGEGGRGNRSTTPQAETSSKGEGGRGNRSTTPQAETSSKGEGGRGNRSTTPQAETSSKGEGGRGNRSQGETRRKSEVARGDLTPQGETRSKKEGGRESSRNRLQRNVSMPARHREVRSGTSVIPATLEKGLQVWDAGIIYNRKVQFSVYPCRCEMSTEERGIEICAAPTRAGKVVFSRLCRMVQQLLQERYPDMFSIDLLLQKHELTQLSICPVCLDSGERHPTSFLVEACVHALMEKTTHNCRYHPKSIPLNDLIPDYLMMDFPSKLHLQQPFFNYNETRPLHRGRSTSLLEGRFRDKDIAVKVYHQMDGKTITLPLYYIRQELEMLTSLDHPNIMQTMGYSLQPPCILLERAPLGNLYQKLMDTEQRISRSVRLHIACQVASALNYLHKEDVIYRTLKASSILLWSLDFSDEISIKLANFERAQFKSPSGLLGKTSFASYPAPEMLRYSFREEYSEKVDIYSFGILLYELVTRWQPFGGIYNTDRIPASQRPKLTGISTTGYATLVRLMEECWQEDATLRPPASDLVYKLSLPSFQCHIATQLLRDCTSVRDCCFVPSVRQVWVYGEYNKESDYGDEEVVEGTQVFILNSDNLTIQGTLELKERASAVFTVDSKVWIGMTEACVHAYDATTFRFTDRFKLSDSVTVITDNDSYIFVAQANGHLSCFPKLAQKESQVVNVEIGSKAIIAMITVSDILWLSCGNELVILNADEEVTVLKRWDACSVTEQIYRLVLSKDGTIVWSITRGSHFITSWDVHTGTLKHKTDLQEEFHWICCELNYDPTYLRMVSVESVRDTLWLGLTCGVIVVFTATEQPQKITYFRAHRTSPKVIMEIPVEEEGGASRDFPMVLTGGFGEISSVASNGSEQNGVIMSWHALKAEDFKLVAKRHSKYSHSER